MALYWIVVVMGFMQITVVLTKLLSVFHCRAPAARFAQCQITLQHLVSQVRPILDHPLLFVSTQSARAQF